MLLDQPGLLEKPVALVALVTPAQRALQAPPGKNQEPPASADQPAKTDRRALLERPANKAARATRGRRDQKARPDPRASSALQASTDWSRERLVPPVYVVLPATRARRETQVHRAASGLTAPRA